MKQIIIRDKIYPIIKEYDEDDKHIIVTRNKYVNSIIFKLFIINSYKTFELREKANHYYSYQTDKLNLYNPLTYLFLIVCGFIVFISNGIKGLKESFGSLSVNHMCCTYQINNVTIREN